MEMKPEDLQKYNARFPLAPGDHWVSVGEMGVFIGFLAVGLVYAWRQGVLTWT